MTSSTRFPWLLLPLLLAVALVEDRACDTLFWHAAFWSFSWAHVLNLGLGLLMLAVLAFLPSLGFAFLPSDAPAGTSTARSWTVIVPLFVLGAVAQANIWGVGIWHDGLSLMHVFPIRYVGLIYGAAPVSFLLVVVALVFGLRPQDVNACKAKMQAPAPLAA